ALLFWGARPLVDHPAADRWLCFTRSDFVRLENVMFHTVLVSPEIPPNTENVIRRPAITESLLHQFSPFGFVHYGKRLRRAGLDYHEWATMQVHDSLAQALAATGAAPGRCFAMTTRGRRHFVQMRFEPGDVFVFGRETAGLSDDERALFDSSQWLR